MHISLGISKSNRVGKCKSVSCTNQTAPESYCRYHTESSLSGCYIFSIITTCPSNRVASRCCLIGFQSLHSTFEHLGVKEMDHSDSKVHNNPQEKPLKFR